MDTSQVISLIAGASVSGIPLIVVVLGLVVYAKRLGIVGKPLLYVSMGIGLVLGAAYQGYVLAIAAGPGPTTGAALYVAIFGIVIYGLLLGLVASGIYDVADGIVTTAVTRLNRNTPFLPGGKVENGTNEPPRSPARPIQPR